MTVYPVNRKAHPKLTSQDLQAILVESFGSARVEPDGLHAAFGALKDLSVALKGKGLEVRTVMDPGVPPEVQMETIRRYNRFLERATGYTTKARAKRLKDQARGAGPGA